MATRVEESIIVFAPLEKVVGGVRQLTFKDGTVQKIRLVELSDLSNSVSYEIIESDPAVDYFSSLQTISVYCVTSDNSTFVRWTAEFSSDASQAVIQDSRYKRKEGLEDLKNAF